MRPSFTSLDGKLRTALMHCYTDLTSIRVSVFPMQDKVPTKPLNYGWGGVPTWYISFERLSKGSN